VRARACPGLRYHSATLGRLSHLPSPLPMTRPKTPHLDTLSLHAGARPDPATGACAAGAPVYRFWNTANGADHRYTRNGKTLDLSVPPLRGYVREGYGPDGVAMCALR